SRGSSRLPRRSRPGRPGSRSRSGLQVPGLRPRAGAYCRGGGGPVLATVLRKFFADRGTHLAAMVAYFALLSFVPLLFLTLSLFGLAHRAEASDFFIREPKHAFPGTS